MKVQLLTMITIVAAMNAAAQDSKSNYHIYGNIKGLNNEWLYKSSEEGGDRDSVRVQGGRFVFAGKVDEPTKMSLYRKKNKGYVSFFAEKNARISITGDATEFDKVKVTGGNTQKDYTALTLLTNDITSAIEALYQSEGDNRPDPADSVTMEKKYDSLSMALRQIQQKFITERPASFVSLYTVKEMIFDLKVEELEKAFDRLDTMVKSSVAGTKLGKLISVKKRTDVGKMALDFSAPDTANHKISLSSFRGKYVLLDFWASWCGPCRAENPNVLKAYNQFKDRNFTVFAVSLDTYRKQWIKAIIEDNMPWTHVCELEKSTVADLYGIYGIPANFLIDPGGKIVAKDLRGAGMTKQLEAIIGK